MKNEIKIFNTNWNARIIQLTEIKQYVTNNIASLATADTSVTDWVVNLVV